MSTSSTSAYSLRKVFEKRPPKEIAGPLTAFSFSGWSCWFLRISGRNISVLHFNPLHKQHFQNTGARVSLGCHHPVLLPSLQIFGSSLSSPTASKSSPPSPLFYPSLKCCSSWIHFSLGLGSSGSSLEKSYFVTKFNIASWSLSVPLSYFIFSFLSGILLLFKLIHVLSFLH